MYDHTGLYGRSTQIYVEYYKVSLVVAERFNETLLRHR